MKAFQASPAQWVIKILRSIAEKVCLLVNRLLALFSPPNRFQYVFPMSCPKVWAITLSTSCHMSVVLGGPNQTCLLRFEIACLNLSLSCPIRLLAYSTKCDNSSLLRNFCKIFSAHSVATAVSTQAFSRKQTSMLGCQALGSYFLILKPFPRKAIANVPLWCDRNLQRTLYLCQTFAWTTYPCIMSVYFLFHIKNV